MQVRTVQHSSTVFTIRMHTVCKRSFQDTCVAGIYMEVT